MKKAKLYLKGKREPIELTEEQGLKAKAVKEDSTILNSENVSLADGLWTGEKGDIRYVMFEVVPEYNKFTKFTSQELEDFEQELNPYFLKESDNEFMDLVNNLVNDIMINRKMFYSKKTTKQINLIKDLHLKEEDIREKAKEIIHEGYVGILTRKGEERFLVDKGLIKLDPERNDFAVIQNSDKSIPFNDMNRKLSEYYDYKGRIAYAEQMDVKHLEEMAAQVGVNEEE